MLFPHKNEHFELQSYLTNFVKYIVGKMKTGLGENKKSLTNKDLYFLHYFSAKYNKSLVNKTLEIYRWFVSIINIHNKTNETQSHHTKRCCPVDIIAISLRKNVTN